MFPHRISFPASPNALYVLAWMALLPFFEAQAFQPPVSQNQSQADVERLAFFEAKIRPVLVEHCYECHSSQTAQEGGLALDTKSAMLTGGEKGAVLIPGDAAKSLLIQAVSWNDPDLKMPPVESGVKLSESQIADFKRWIDEGAFDPRVEGQSINRKSWEEKFRERLEWWSLRPVRRASLPKVNEPAWSGNIIDPFLLEAMKLQGVDPSPIADARTLIRRATLVLTGLPPTPSDVESFVEKHASDPQRAYESLIDSLLASDAFGERFAKHWLDVVRFTETHGNEWNYDVPYAYRYRDYMIRAIVGDLPYNQWIREHIAGDLLPNPRWNASTRTNESIIGTAFYRFGEVNHDSCVQFSVIGYDIADNQVDTLSKAFQATTVSCARCHDHKLDAISTKDYHAYLGIVRSSRSVQHTLDDSQVNVESFAKLRELKSGIRRELIRIWKASLDGINEESLAKASEPLKEKAPGIEHPLHAWIALTASVTPGQDFASSWEAKSKFALHEMEERLEFNESKFDLLYDFRDGIPNDWSRDGMGLRNDQSSKSPVPDIVVSHEGESAIKRLLPRGVFTCSLSDKMNGALRSPTLPRSRGKISFEVIGGGFSLTRIVFNNCQLNYNHQHSIHHPDWSWVTIDIPEGTESLFPYAELLTYWDNPKFPDPLGTLGKDTENQRLPFAEHAKNPRTWFGIRRIVAHQEAATPKDDLRFLEPLYRAHPTDPQSLAAVYRDVTSLAIERFAAGQASDDDVRWLDAMLQAKLLESRANASNDLEQSIGRYRDIENHYLSLPTTMPGMADEWSGFSQPILARGDLTKPGELVSRRFLQALDPEGQTTVQHGSGRAMLAEAIADEHNPLTARVFVNRVWHWIFGQGLVRTPDDFGHLGDLPSHPELLDTLSVDFMESGWSLKKLVKKIMMSRAFQGESSPTRSAAEIDPENRWLSHYPARRAEAEVIRDSLLFVSGRLDRKLYGPSIHPYREKADTEKRLYTGPIDGEGRRSIYLKFQLMESPRFLSAFNLPGGKVTQGRRDNSNVPAQSLAMMNDPFVWAMAEHWAKRLVSDGGSSPEQRIDRMFHEAVGRPASQREIARFMEAVKRFATELNNLSPSDLKSNAIDSSLMQDERVWRELAHAMFNLKEFIYVP